MSEDTAPAPGQIAMSKRASSGSPDSLSMLLPPSPPSSISETVVRDPGYEPAPLRIARQFVEALNTQNWEHECKAAFAPGYRARHDNWKADLSHEEQHKLYMATLARFPKFHMEILGESIDIDELNGRATVFHFIRMTGAPEGVQRDGLGLMKWRREHGKWLCYHHAGFRSCGAVF